MLKRCLAITSVLVLASGCGGDDGLLGSQADEIVGGDDTTIQQHPWQISLQTSSGSHFCGGSILNDEWILTAQHCVVGESPSSMRIEAGATQLSANGQVRNIDEIMNYPGYVTPELGKDATLLHLSSPLSLSGSVSGIAYATSADAAPGLTDRGLISTVSGWGSLSSGGSSPNTLQAVDVPLVSNAVAQQLYTQETITADQLAAADLNNGGEDACQGDSGGPLTVPDGQGGRLLAGIVSWGYGCADAQYPGMYGRVSFFDSWINDIVNSTPITALNETGLSGSSGDWTYYTVNVPSGSVSLSVNMSGGSGDADLYVRYGSQPTTGSYDCRPYLNGNNESCSFSSPSAGTWHIGVRAYSTYSGANLAASYRVAGSASPEICNDGVDNDEDGFTDCADSDCSADPACAPSSETNCTDGVDNDSDGDTDCADSDCSADPACQGPSSETNCTDGVDNDSDGDTDCADSDCSADPACQSGGWVTLSSTDFESGWGGYTDGGNDVRRSANDSAYANSGNYCVRIRDNSGSASSFYSSNGFDISGYSQLQVEFSFYARGMESGEDFLVELWDGSSWVVIGQYARGTDFNNNTRYNPTITVNSSQVSFSSGALIRFRNDASQNNDRVYIDDIVISAQ